MARRVKYKAFEIGELVRTGQMSTDEVLYTKGIVSFIRQTTEDDLKERYTLIPKRKEG